MTHRMMPVISIFTLVKELKSQYDIEIGNRALTRLLWWEAPANDSYKMYCYGDGPCEGCDPIEECVIALLEDNFPQYEEILIDVTW